MRSQGSDLPQVEKKGISWEFTHTSSHHHAWKRNPSLAQWTWWQCVFVEEAISLAWDFRRGLFGGNFASFDFCFILEIAKGSVAPGVPFRPPVSSHSWRTALFSRGWLIWIWEVAHWPPISSSLSSPLTVLQFIGQSLKNKWMTSNLNLSRKIRCSPNSLFEWSC